MKKLEGVANTTYVPLIARIAVSKRFPEYFFDQAALDLEAKIPAGAEKGSYEYSNMASVARYYNLDGMISAFADAHEACNVVLLGLGLETAVYRLDSALSDKDVRWFGVDLPETIAQRRAAFGEEDALTLVEGDMFAMEWADAIDASRPTLLVVSGVFQYFEPDQVKDFVCACAAAFPCGEMAFDATNEDGLKFANRFIKRTGNADALMRFFVNDAHAFADETSTTLMEERVFFEDALCLLGRRLGIVSRISMRVADKKRRTKLIRLGFPGK